MEKRAFYIFKKIKDGTLHDIWNSTKWMYQYARNYWKQMVVYTLIGLSGTAISLVSSLLSKVWLILLPVTRPDFYSKPFLFL